MERGFCNRFETGFCFFLVPEYEADFQETAGIAIFRLSENVNAEFAGQSNNRPSKPALFPSQFDSLGSIISCQLMQNTGHVIADCPIGQEKLLCDSLIG